MTHPSDIAGLSEIERICNGAEHDAADLVRRLAGQPMQHNASVLRETFKLIRAEAEKQRAKLDALTAKERRLREILCACAAAIGNGAAMSPVASIEFMEQLPSEIAAYTGRMRDAAKGQLVVVNTAMREREAAESRAIRAEKERDEAVTALERLSSFSISDVHAKTGKLSDVCKAWIDHKKEALAAIRRLASGQGDVNMEGK